MTRRRDIISCESCPTALQVGGLDEIGHGARMHRFVRLVRVPCVGNLCYRSAIAVLPIAAPLAVKSAGVRLSMSRKDKTNLASASLRREKQDVLDCS